MIKYFVILLPLALFLGSCKNTWSQEDKDMFYKSCFDDAKTWAGSEANAKTYCDCTLKTIMKKYPNVNDMMEHMEDVIQDTDLQKCKLTIMRPDSVAQQ